MSAASELEMRHLEMLAEIARMADAADALGELVVLLQRRERLLGGLEADVPDLFHDAAEVGAEAVARLAALCARATGDPAELFLECP